MQMKSLAHERPERTRRFGLSVHREQRLISSVEDRPDLSLRSTYTRLALSPHPSSPNVPAVNEQTPASPLTRRPAQLCGLLSVPSALLKVSGRAAQNSNKSRSTQRGQK